MSFWEWLTDFFDRRAGTFEPPPNEVPEYDRPEQPSPPRVRLTRVADDQRAEEALDFLRTYVAGVRAEHRRRPPRP